MAEQVTKTSSGMGWVPEKDPEPVEALAEEGVEVDLGEPCVNIDLLSSFIEHFDMSWNIGHAVSLLATRKQLSTGITSTLRAACYHLEREIQRLEEE